MAEHTTGTPTGDTAVVIPAYDEAQRISATVEAARSIGGVDLVVVVDDGSTDDTGTAARAAGAVLARHGRNRGKAAAMETGAAVVAAIDVREGREQPRHLLFLDADLERTAAAAAPLIDPVRAGTAAMTIAVLPPQLRAGGGRGFVVRAARDGIARACGFTATQPLSGQRCLTREAFEAALPLAAGFGVETGLTIDLVREGFAVEEVEVELHHRVTGTDFAAQRHRARQYAHVARALAERGAAGALPGAIRGRG
ncbi:glycosyltransferase [Embleya sp. NBC_00888]|uniref:glycosyltransferase n=1 Tax=Embleya sp. NBC_00888 TaxID=2975960 RepID=UPI0038647683|nr:glycosyltransferase [Embleya sp. NBC_00888]